MMMWRHLILAGVIGIGLVTPPPTLAQENSAPCGYVNGFEFPVPDIDLDHTDFGIYRSRWGGFHTGIDVAFGQLGAPVRAAARGRVTYSDIAGWDTEKGVVVIQHTFPDGTLVNTLYGHMEELNSYTFPAMNQCVEAGDIIGAIGAPSLSSPHLHYEIRTRYRHEGGPGYTDVNPLELGWLHPVDFTFLARIWVTAAHRQHLSLTRAITVPPLYLPDGHIVIAQNTHLEERALEGQLLWQFDALGSVSGLLALPDGRIAAATSANQVLVLNNGSYSALWSIPRKPVLPPVVFGDAIIFATEARTVMALTPDGARLWETAPLPSPIRRWAVNQDRLAVATQDGDLWIVDQAGNILYEASYEGVLIPVAAPDGEFVLLNNSTILRLDVNFLITNRFDTGRPVTPTAEFLLDPEGTLYLYTGEGRSLYAYRPDGTLYWIAYMPGSFLRAPLLGVGSGRLIYALTTDGQLLAYTTGDGRLVAQFALYNGGIDGSVMGRWLVVQPDDQVFFSSGYLSIAAIDGAVLPLQ